MKIVLLIQASCRCWFAILTVVSRDAHDAVRERDGSRVLGERIRVEIAKGTSGPPPAPRDWRDKGTGFRIIVDGLPKHASWQDLKVGAENISHNFRIGNSN